MNLKLLAAAAMAITSVVTTPALALEQVWRMDDGYAIRFRDLDLSRPEGQREAMRRIELASRLICTGVMHRDSRAECLRDTQRDVVDRLPAATRLALQRGHAVRYAERTVR